MNNQQLALELPIATCRHSHRALRAQWWFERMRQIIDLAPDPEPIAEPAARVNSVNTQRPDAAKIETNSR